MTEEQLITKTFFKDLVEEQNQLTPVKSLGHLFYTADKETDLSPVRFAQGEVYYHHKDMESAVFKWEQVKGDLEPWAKKNIGDAYYEMGMLREAENMYTSIPDNGSTLSIEVSLQLISIYAERNNSSKMHQHITKVLAADPDYPNVTDIARAFYENEQNWKKAVELSVSELDRTGQRKWFNILVDYAYRGFTTEFEPVFFKDLLTNLAESDRHLYAQLLKALWTGYGDKGLYIEWLSAQNELLNDAPIEEETYTKEIVPLFDRSYTELMSGRYALDDLKKVVPVFLTQWMSVTDGKEAVKPSAALKAWEEELPGTFEASRLEEADRKIGLIAAYEYKTEGITALSHDILNWARENDVLTSPVMNWLLDKEWHEKDHHIMITGRSQALNTHLINLIAGEEVFEGGASGIVMLPGEQAALQTLDRDGLKTVDDINELSDEEFALLTWPSELLRDMNGMLIAVPFIPQTASPAMNVASFWKAASDIVYTIDPAAPDVEDDFNILSNLQDTEKGISVQVVLADYAGEGADLVFERLNELFPEFDVISLTSVTDNKQLAGKIRSRALKARTGNTYKVAQLIRFNRALISYLLNQRETKEETNRHSVSFNKELVAHTDRFMVEMDKSIEKMGKKLTESFAKVNGKLKDEISKDLPSILRETADELHEDSDTANLHIEINDMMNRKIDGYMADSLMPSLKEEMDLWQKEAALKMDELQHRLNEMETALITEDGSGTVLKADYQLLTDWKRDINRMINRINIGELNIMNRVTPSQMLLKGAGKLFGHLQNKQMLYQQYEKYIVNDSFEDTIETVIYEAFREFDMFERNIAPDLKLSVEEPKNKMALIKSQSVMNIEGAEETLKLMHEHPASFYDPLKIFSIRLGRYENIYTAE